MSRSRVGTSGWSYPSGRGPGTASSTRPASGRRKGFDELRTYAEHFDTVEVNSTFYGQPRPRRRARLGRAHAARLRVLREAVSEVHAPGHVPRARRAALPQARPGMDAEDAMRRTGAADRRGYRRVQARHRAAGDSGRLGALLAQFPASFKHDTAGVDLAALLRRCRLPGRRRAPAQDLERRVAETLRLLNDFGAAWVQIDEPKFRLSIRQNYLPNVHGFYYMRLHGRNAATWWRHERAEDRYDYLYSTRSCGNSPRSARAASELVRKSTSTRTTTSRRSRWPTR